MKPRHFAEQSNVWFLFSLLAECFLLRWAAEGSSSPPDLQSSGFPGALLTSHIRADSGMWFTCLTQPPHGGLLFLSKLFQCITAHNDTEHWEPDYLCWNSGCEQEPVALIILFMSKLGFAPHSPFNISENLYPLTLLDNSLASLKLTSFNILFFFPGTSIIS